MSIQTIIRNVPLGTRLYCKVQSYATAGSNKRIINEVFDADHPQAPLVARSISSILNRPSQEAGYWKKRIELQRKSMLKNHGPLIDGSLGEGGLYDQNKTVSDACKVSKPPLAAMLLHALAYNLKPQNVLELGTNVGVSSAYIASALHINNQDSCVTTLDASAYRQQLAKQLHQSIGLQCVDYVHGLFTDTLTRTLAQLQTVDMAFIDGHHQYQPTLDYFEQILPYATPFTLFVFDDIRWSDGMKKAWLELREDQRFGLVVDLGMVGLCLLKHPQSDARFVSDIIQVF
ncbi:MAG: O-methyltransferase [Phycisphaeraceae bacterium JB051]